MFLFRLLLVLLCLACLGSFAWGMRRFFKQPAGATAGMAFIKWAGTFFAAIHLGVLIGAGPASLMPALAAAGLYACAWVLYWWAIQTNRLIPLSAVYSPDLPRHLVTWGPYGYVRHPFYLSYLLFWLAGTAAAGGVLLLPTVIIMYALYQSAANLEEKKFSRSLLAAEYESYRACTGRFLPRLAFPAKPFVFCASRNRNELLASCWPRNASLRHDKQGI